MQPDIPNSFLRLLSEGFDSVEEDKQLRLFAVESYLSLLRDRPAKLSQRFLQVISWVLGEYSYLKEGLEPATVLRLLAPLLDLRHCSSETKNWVLTAMTKLCEGPACVSWAQELADRHSGSLDTVLRQRLHELQHLAAHAELRIRVLPRNVGLEPLEVDSSLSFLDGFVSEALAAGAEPYKPPHQRQEELAHDKALSVEPYGLSLPLGVSDCSVADRLSPAMSSGLSGDSTELSHKGGSSALKLDGVRRVWGKEGYLTETEAAVTVEETAQVDVPCPLGLSALQEGVSVQTPISSMPTPTVSHTPEADREKQQLASSLFVGLGPQSSTGPCLMGKAEPTPHRFRRKVKGQGSSSGTSEQSCDSTSSSHSLSPLCGPNAVDNLLCRSLLDSGSALPPVDSAPHLPHDLPTTHNGPRLAREDLTEDTSLIEASDMAAVNPDMRTDLHNPEHFHLSSHLPCALSKLPRSEITPLCSDTSLALSACRVQTDHASLIVIFVANTSDSAARQFALRMTSGDLEVALENVVFKSNLYFVCYFVI